MSTRYNPVRWVCQWRAEICDGKFYAQGALRDCPLASKCKDTTIQRTPYEYMYPRQMNDPQRYLEHAKRSSELRRVFLTGADNPDKAYYQANKDHLSYYHKERWRVRQELKQAAETPAVVLPCGCDCEQCPYDDGCHYQHDDDVSVTFKRPGPTPAVSEPALRKMVRDGLTIPQMSKLTGTAQKALRKRCAYFGLKPKRAIAKIKKKKEKET